ncbi:MAG: glycine cleavage system protein GcvH [Armatimonadota bacterium]|jgi:glycine cleavage system H protein
MEFPEDLRYSKDHEWVRVDGDRATIGISDYAQDNLQDVVFIDLPEVGRQLQQGDIFGSIESVKAVSDLISPVSGEVIAVNEELPDAPEIVNQDPYVGGWMIVVQMDDPSEVEELMTAEQYREYVEEL